MTHRYSQRQTGKHGTCQVGRLVRCTDGPPCLIRMDREERREGSKGQS